MNWIIPFECLNLLLLNEGKKIYEGKQYELEFFKVFIEKIIKEVIFRRFDNFEDLVD